jgi:hypothetical protein
MKSSGANSKRIFESLFQTISCVASHTVSSDLAQSSLRPRQVAGDSGFLGNNGEVAGSLLHGCSSRLYALGHETGHVARAMQLQRAHADALLGDIGGGIVVTRSQSLLNLLDGKQACSSTCVRIMAGISTATRGRCRQQARQRGPETC